LRRGPLEETVGEIRGFPPARALSEAYLEDQDQDSFNSGSFQGQYSGFQDQDSVYRTPVAVGGGLRAARVHSASRGRGGNPNSRTIKEDRGGVKESYFTYEPTSKEMTPAGH